jgi:hypothetical protein
LKDGKILGSYSMSNPLKCNFHVKYLLVLAWNIMVGYRLCSGRWKAWIVYSKRREEKNGKGGKESFKFETGV